MIRRIAAALVVAAWSVAGLPALQDLPADEPAVGLESGAASPSSEDPLAQILDDEEMRLRGELEGLENRRAAAEDAEARERVEHAERTEKIVDAAERVRAAAPGSPEADALYDEAVTALQNLRPRLREVLRKWNDPIPLPQGRIELDPAVRATPAFEEREERFRSILADIEAESEALRRAVTDARWAAVELRAIRVDRINALRIECLPKLSFGKRQRVLSIVSREGIAQFRRELDQLSLSVRVYALRREHRVVEIPSRMKDIFRVGSVTWTFVKLVALVAVLIWCRRRWKDWIEEARQFFFRRVRSVRSKRRVERILGAVEVVGPWTLVLAALVVARRLFVGFQDFPEMELAYRIALVYGAYRLGIDAAYALLVSAASRYHLAMDQGRRQKLFRSVRAVARLVAAIVVVLSLSALLLGKGYLYHVTVLVAWIFGVVIAVRLLSSWRQEISEAYLKVQPTGRLADAVRKTREKWYGIFVAGTSFGWLFGRAVAVLAREFALGFDQTRRALAFLFRRRMEKQAEQRGYAEDSPEKLPKSLVAAFGTDTVPEASVVVDNFPGTGVLQSSLAEWTAGRGGGGFLIHGDTGIGKTSWLTRVAADGVPKSDVVLDARPGSADGLAEAFSATLFPEETHGTCSALVQALRAGPPRIVTVDSTQNLFLARVGGYDAFRAFADIVSETGDRVFWVASLNALAYVHLRAVRPEISVFRQQVRLPSWSEPHIRELIRARLDSSGVVATYEDLVVDRMEGVSAQATLLQTEEGYTRLLWDYADGNPRVALHFWLRSVVPESERRVRVRLFRAPDAALLEAGGEPGLFVLAAVMNHENLSGAEIVEVTRIRPEICRIHVGRLEGAGALSREGDRYRVSTHWQRAAIRLLRRRNLLPD